MSLIIAYRTFLQVKPFKCHVSQKVSSNVPHARSWLRAVGTIKSPAHVRNNMTTFIVRATQYVSGTGPTIQHAEFDIQIRHNSDKKNLHERTKKAKIGSKVSIVGELDVYNNKLYLELHNFDFLSLDPSPQTTSTNQMSRDHSTVTPLSEKRTLMYKSLFDNSKTTPPVKRSRTDSTVNRTTPSSSNPSTIESDCDSPKAIKQEKEGRHPTRQLRSNTSSKIANLASTKLNLPPHE